MADTSKVTQIRFNPIEGDPYEVGKPGGRKITLAQAQNGQWIESPFAWTPEIKHAKAVLKDKQPKREYVEPNTWRPQVGKD